MKKFILKLQLKGIIKQIKSETWLQQRKYRENSGKETEKKKHGKEDC